MAQSYRPMSLGAYRRQCTNGHLGQGLEMSLLSAGRLPRTRRLSLPLFNMAPGVWKSIDLYQLQHRSPPAKNISKPLQGGTHYGQSRPASKRWRQDNSRNQNGAADGDGSGLGTHDFNSSLPFGRVRPRWGKVADKFSATSYQLAVPVPMWRAVPANTSKPLEVHTLASFRRPDCLHSVITL